MMIINNFNKIAAVLKHRSYNFLIDSSVLISGINGWQANKYTLFFYKNNFIRTTRLKVAQKLGTS